MLNFYRRFLPHAAATQAPLHDVLSGPRIKGSHPITWTLKAAIMCHADQRWTEALPLVLLGIRTAFKEDLQASVAELVYAAAHRADRISEVTPQPALASVGQPPIATIMQEIEELSHRMAAFSDEQGRPCTGFRNPPLGPSTSDPRLGLRNRRPNSRSPVRGSTEPTLCWYHRRFGDRARKCKPPCAHRQQGN
jgi:hypothetical protein